MALSIYNTKHCHLHAKQDIVSCKMHIPMHIKFLKVKFYGQETTARQVEDWTRLQHPHWKTRVVIYCKSPKLECAKWQYCHHLETLHLTSTGLSPPCRYYSSREMPWHGAFHHRTFLLWENSCACACFSICIVQVHVVWKS